MRGGRVSLAAGAAALLLAACGGGDDRIVRTGSVPVRIKADGRLNSDPAPLTLAQVNKAPRGSAQRAVMQLFFWQQWGAIPNAIAMYDSTVRTKLGTAKMSDAITYQRTGLLGYLPRIRDVDRTDLGTFVAVVSYNHFTPPQHDSFLLRRQDGRWQIAYDTLLERGLGLRAANLVTGGTVTPSRDLTERANRAAVKASREYRLIFLSTSVEKELEGFRAQADSQ